MAKEAETLVKEFCRIVAGIVARLLRKNGAGESNCAQKQMEEDKK